MKKIINKIIAILDYDVYRFTLAPFVIFFSSYRKKSIPYYFSGAVVSLFMFLYQLKI